MTSQCLILLTRSQYFGFVEEGNAFDTYVVRNPLKTLQGVLLSNETAMASRKRTELLAYLDSLLAKESFIDSDLILRGKGKLSWSLGSLECLKEQDMLPVNAFEEVKDDAYMESTLNKCITILVSDQVEKINSFVSRNKLSDSNDGNIQNSFNDVAVNFLNEKRSILRSAHELK